MQLSVLEAATQAGVSKSTILRAIGRGRISATRGEDGVFTLDAAEVARVFPRRADPRAAPRGAVQLAAGFAAGGGASGAADAVEMRVHNASLEAQVQALREMLDAEKRRSDEWKATSAQWQETAQRLLLAAPVITPPPPSVSAPTTPATVPPRSRWRWWARQAS